MRSLGRWGVVLCFLFATVRAANTGSDDTIKVGNNALFGTLEIEMGEMLKARLATGSMGGSSQTLDHVWFGRTIGRLFFLSEPTNWLKVRGGFEFRQYFNMFNYRYSAEKQYGDLQMHDFFIREAQGIFSVLKNETMSLDITFGYFPYKYSPECSDLGEFLFRSGTYPFYLIGEFDEPFARLTGIRGSFNYGTENLKVKFDGMILTEREIRPFYDISPAAILSVNIMKMFDIGTGIDFAHLIPVNGTITTPHSGDNMYIDTVSNDTGYYTFTGTKVMVRAAIDPFDMFRGEQGSIMNEILGKNGGKIYGEWAIIGLENYPANRANPYGYDKVKEKSPWMAGVTIPAWKILDLCAFEIERYPAPYPNNYYQLVTAGTPTPAPNRNPPYDPAGYAFERWYWSLTMKKQIARHFGVIAEFGRNHQRWEMAPANVLNYDYEDAMVKPDHWGWHFKTVFNF